MMMPTPGLSSLISCSFLGRRLDFAKSGGFIGLREGWQGDWAFSGDGRWLTMADHKSTEAGFRGNTVAVVLVPVALSYGVDPAAILPKFMKITVEGTDQTHILRALMSLYLGMSVFCILAAFTPE